MTDPTEARAALLRLGKPERLPQSYTTLDPATGRVRLNDDGSAYRENYYRYVVGQDDVDAIEAARAALPDDGREGLDAAWAAVEAVLPEGWGIEIVPNEYRAPEQKGRWLAMIVRDIPSIGSSAKAGYGNTPAAALRDLAAAAALSADKP